MVKHLIYSLSEFLNLRQWQNNPKDLALDKHKGTVNKFWKSLGVNVSCNIINVPEHN